MGITLPHLLIIAVLVVLLFGTKKLRSLGSDLGASIKGFKKAMDDEGDNAKSNTSTDDADFNAKLVNQQQNQAVKKEDVKNDKV